MVVFGGLGLMNFEQASGADPHHGCYFRALICAKDLNKLVNKCSISDVN